MLKEKERKNHNGQHSVNVVILRIAKVRKKHVQNVQHVCIRRRVSHWEKYGKNRNLMRSRIRPNLNGRKSFDAVETFVGSVP